MIIKSSQRAGSGRLAKHLTNAEENEQVIFSESRHLLADDVHGAIDDMHLMAMQSNCQKPFYHVSISPNQSVNDENWAFAWQVYETEYGLENHAFVEVTHQKEGRLHKHRVYSRIKDDGTALQISHNYPRNEKVARILEHTFGHDLTPGRFNRSIIQKLKDQGFIEIATWMENAKAHEQQRPAAELNHTDHQQQKRTKIPVKVVKADLQDAYNHTDTGKAFEAAIAEKGYVLAKGDKRDYVIIDKAGGLHSPRRRLGVKVAELRQRWSDLNPDYLPTVDAVKQAQNPIHAVNRAIEDGDRVKAIALIDEQISQLQNIQDQRDLIEQFDIYKDRERNKPLERAIDTSHIVNSDFYQKRQAYKRCTKKFEAVTLAVMMTYTGEQAEMEKTRRLAHVQRIDSSSKEKRDRRPFKQYLRELKALMKEKGESIYQRADRFIAEKLMRRNVSKASICKSLVRSSPHVMNQHPNARISYIRTIVEQAYRRTHSQKRTSNAEKERKSLQKKKSQSKLDPEQSRHRRR